MGVLSLPAYITPFYESLACAHIVKDWDWGQWESHMPRPVLGGNCYTTTLTSVAKELLPVVPLIILWPWLSGAPLPCSPSFLCLHKIGSRTIGTLSHHHQAAHDWAVGWVTAMISRIEKVAEVSFILKLVGVSLGSVSVWGAKIITV